MSSGAVPARVNGTPVLEALDRRSRRALAQASVLLAAVEQAGALGEVHVDGDGGWFGGRCEVTVHGPEVPWTLVADVNRRGQPFSGVGVHVPDGPGNPLQQWASIELDEDEDPRPPLTAGLGVAAAHSVWRDVARQVDIGDFDSMLLRARLEHFDGSFLVTADLSSGECVRVSLPTRNRPASVHLVACRAGNQWMPAAGPFGRFVLADLSARWGGLTLSEVFEPFAVAVMARGAVLLGATASA